MASHFVSVARGVVGTRYSDFTTGAASNATALFELRILDGVTPTRVEVEKAIKGFERFFLNAQQTNGFDIKG